jgi:hypothetical protein
LTPGPVDVTPLPPALAPENKDEGVEGGEKRLLNNDEGDPDVLPTPAVAVDELGFVVPFPPLAEPPAPAPEEEELVFATGVLDLQISEWDGNGGIVDKDSECPACPCVVVDALVLGPCE